MLSPVVFQATELSINAAASQQKRPRKCAIKWQMTNDFRDKPKGKNEKRDPNLKEMRKSKKRNLEKSGDSEKREK